jgi:hypothetical protein
MPPISGASEYLIDYLFEIGPTMHDSMGAARLTNEEVLAWQINTGIRLPPRECRWLIRLSGEFLYESHKAEKRDAVPPWSCELSADDLRAVAASLRADLHNMAA